MYTAIIMATNLSHHCEPLRALYAPKYKVCIDFLFMQNDNDQNKLTSFACTLAMASRVVPNIMLA